MTPEGPCLHTARLELRWFTLDDAPLMRDIWNSPDFLRFVGDRGIRSIHDARSALAKGPIATCQEYGYGPFRVGLHDNTGIGICGLFHRPGLDMPDLGFALLPSWYRQGFGREAAQAVLDYCDNDLALPRVAALVSPDNSASLALLKRLGFEFVSPLELEADTVRLFVRNRPAVPAGN